MSRYMNHKNLKIQNIIYKDPIDKISIIFHNNNLNVEPLLFTTPILVVKDIINNRIVLDLINNTQFHDFIKMIDELNITNCYYNSKKWFKKELSLSLIEEYYKSPISNNLVEFMLPVNSNKELQLDYILDKNKKYTNVHSIKEDSLVKLNIKYVGIQFKGTSFFPKIEVKSIKIYNSIKKHIDTDSSDNDSSDNDFTDED
jgi:hypothetical protein